MPIKVSIREYARKKTGAFTKAIVAGMAGALFSASCSTAQTVAQETDTQVQQPWEMSLSQFRAKVQEFSPGQGFEPGAWPDGAKVGVLLSFDVDNETLSIIEEGDLFLTAYHQFGSRRGLKRILRILDKHEVPATFFTPVMALRLYPEIVEDIQAAGIHEFAAHGWIHERVGSLPADEQLSLMRRTTETLEELTGQRPVGYRAPYGVINADSFDALKELGYVYDTSVVSDDYPFMLLKNGQEFGLVEIPPSINLEDSLIDPLNSFSAGIQSPKATLESYKSAFDVAYEEGGMVLLIMHPHVTGKLSRVEILDEFIAYAKSHEGVWFGTHLEAAEHFLEQIETAPAP